MFYTVVVMMGLIMLLAGVLIPQNLVTPPLYIDGGCDDRVDHAAGLLSSLFQIS